MFRSKFSPIRVAHQARFLRQFNSRKSFSSMPPCETADVLVAGCGIAGCGAALTLAEKGLKVTVLSATENRNESNSFYAQGGIIYDKGSPSILVEDIIVAGAGHSDPIAAFELANKGPQAIEELLFQTSNVDFDLDKKGNLALCLEAAHSVPRIIHNKDQTGKAIMEAMTQQVANHPNIKLISNVTAVDLITNSESTCTGAYIMNNDTHDIYPIHASDTILATGGLGDIFEHTSNPTGSRGDGIAMALRAGVKVENMEYVQFHPTSLYIPGQSRFLLTEALRGEGAELLTADTQEPFMKKYHDLGTLAPRDIVSRGVFSEMQRTQSDHVWLDISHKPKDWIEKRFPTITAKCKSYGLDLTNEPVPIVPCAHYSCGGITVDKDGQTTLSGLKAIGEVSCTGLHGGNRLASTSLVEGLVWGRNAALAIHKEKMHSYQDPIVSEYRKEFSVKSGIINDDTISDTRDQLKNIMWDDVGIVRNFEGMDKAAQKLDEMRSIVDNIYDQSLITPDLIGLRNSIHVGQVINRSAMENIQSVGAHYRSDAVIAPKKNTEEIFSGQLKNSRSAHNSVPIGGMQGIPAFASSAGFGTLTKPARRTFSSMPQVGFPSLTVKSDTLIPRGTFAEAQAMFLKPDQSTILDLNKLLKEKNIGIVAHFYMDPEIQGVLNACDWPHIKVGDSLVMGDYAVDMAEQGIDGIICLGVDFMSENVQAILRANGHNTPVYRCTEKSIGCSLAESAEGLNYAAYLTKASKVPNALHVVYINTSLSTKAHAHSLVPTITCTSSNVVQTVLQAYAQIPDCKVFFGPDTYMGENLHQLFTYMANDMTDEQIAAVHSAHNKASIRDLLSRFNYFGQGICVVHHMFGQKVVDRVRNEHPDAYYTAHFEVPGEMFQLAMEAQQKGEGVVGSTSGILNFIVEKVQNAATDSKLKFVLGTEAGMITPLVKAIQEVLSNKPGQNIEAEIIFPVSSEAVAQDHDFGVVPGVASGEGCSVSGGCATCPFMKMNSLNSLSDLLELIGSPESSRLFGYYPKVYNEMINGISAFELGTLPIHHMREYGQKNYFGDVLLNDVVTRNNPTVQKDEKVQKHDEKIRY